MIELHPWLSGYKQWEIEQLKELAQGRLDILWCGT
jgi:hypothetical protein